ncbi:MAG TPA: DUF1566 domain-containing protein [Polyangia bacterium]|nr:DUF1566 domain-containing protein [Polyangia bacterium]
MLVGCSSSSLPASHPGGGAPGGHGGNSAGTGAGNAGGNTVGSAGSDGQAAGGDGQVSGNGNASGSGGAATGGRVGTGGGAGAGAITGTGGGSGGVVGAAGNGSGTGGAGGLSLGGSIDPRWAGWPMPNDTADVAAGAPNPMAYSVSVDGTVTDDVTGLVWQQTPPSSQYTWSNAKTYCPGLSLANRRWRLPTPIELASLIDDTVVSPGPTINATAFPGTPANSSFWSSLADAGQTGYAWAVGFGGGFVDTYATSSTFSVRCVGIDPNATADAGAPPARYTSAGATVYDAGTRLTWQEFPAPTPMTWADAKAYCAGSLVAALGGTGWRLPTKKELLTLVDFGVARPGPTIDTTALDATADYFWSASPLAGMSASAWRVYFGMGNPEADVMSNTAQVRCVR